MTILPAVYVPQSRPGGVMESHYQGSLLDVSAAAPWIACSTSIRMHTTYKNPRGIPDGRMDTRHPSDNWDQFYAGYCGEAAYAIHHGLPIELILDDSWGKPDFTHQGAYVDVKTTFTGTSTSISLRADILDKPDLQLWRFIGAKVSKGGHLVTLIGSVPGSELHRYPISAPARGHDKRYIRIPMRDLAPIGGK